jgi:citrate synthase
MTAKDRPSEGGKDRTLSVVDNRTGKQYELPIQHDTIRAVDLRQIRVNPADFGMMSYDPSFMNTAACNSTVTFIDGGKGILRYRGYPIDQLAERRTYLEVAYLLMNGDLPTEAELHEWTRGIITHSAVPPSLTHIIDGFPPDAHAMGLFISTLAALSTFYPEAKQIGDPEIRQAAAYRLIAVAPALAAFAYRHSIGKPYIHHDSSLSYAGNFLRMMFAGPEASFAPDPVLERALDVLFILHADHEQNCSANAMRGVGSSHVDPYCASAAAAAALYGPLHGGANEAVLRMLDHIGTKDNVPGFITGIKEGKGRLMGFGHRVYKNYDPRASIIKSLADQVFDVTGRNPRLEIALELERIALQDDYFVTRKLYPNVDFYSGLIYQAMGFPVPMFPVLFAIGRMAGWLAQWQEMLTDAEQRIARPRQVYLGESLRDVPPRT